MRGSGQPGSPAAAKSSCTAGATGGQVSEADVAAAEVPAAQVPASGITARVARISLSTTVTLGGGVFTAELREQRLGDQAPGEGRREAAEQGAAHAAEHASAATEGSLYCAGPARLRAGGHPGERAWVVASGALVFGHGRAQVAQRRAPLLWRQLRKSLLMRLLDRLRRGGPHEVAVALERLLVRQFARGGRGRRGSVLPRRRFGPSTATKETIQKSHGGDLARLGWRVRVTRAGLVVARPPRGLERLQSVDDVIARIPCRTRRHDRRRAAILFLASPDAWFVNCDCRPFVSAIGPIAGFGRQAALSVERADDLAVGAALLDVRQRLEGLVERERLVDERAEVAGVVEGGQLAQLPAVGLHEQKRVAHA